MSHSHEGGTRIPTLNLNTDLKKKNSSAVVQVFLGIPNDFKNSIRLNFI